ncbi:MAG: SRPBCC domain-containing protein [Chitinophagales bacterium]|nr:SRPBCC domain-containing protein [Chitinophagales bacterium]
MKSFKKYFIIPEEPLIVYKALTNENTIQLWTGEDATMSEEVDTEFEIFGGSICGRNIEFIEGEKIVQEWYFGEQEEESIVTIKLHEHKKGTSLELTHTNIPDEAYEDITEGWEQDFIAALIDFFEEE